MTLDTNSEGKETDKRRVSSYMETKAVPLEPFINVLRKRKHSTCFELDPWTARKGFVFRATRSSHEVGFGIMTEEKWHWNKHNTLIDIVALGVSRKTTLRTLLSEIVASAKKKGLKRVSAIVCEDDELLPELLAQGFDEEARIPAGYNRNMKYLDVVFFCKFIRNSGRQKLIR